VRVCHRRLIARPIRLEAAVPVPDGQKQPKIFTWPDSSSSGYAASSGYWGRSSADSAMLQALPDKFPRAAQVAPATRQLGLKKDQFIPAERTVFRQHVKLFLVKVIQEQLIPCREVFRSLTTRPIRVTVSPGTCDRPGRLGAGDGIQRGEIGGGMRPDANARPGGSRPARPAS
jgi:hypothetical protein